MADATYTEIRNSLKAFLENQAEFTDYNFEGSALSTLVDILAYNALYLNTNANMVFSEGFLDTAVQRGSVVSRAKELGYLPRSKRGAVATIRMSFAVSGNPSQYILPKNTKFATSIDGTSYTFCTTEDITFSNVANIFTKDISITQGILTNYSYTVNTSNLAQRFIIPSKEVDTSYLTASIKDSVGATVWRNMIYINDINLGDVASDTEVFFLQESFDEYYEVYFGDGNIGASVENGNVVKFDYLITSGPDANGANSFSLSSTLSGVSVITITTLTSATGGMDKETVESIKYLAPFYYASQNRAVTKDDYKSIIMNKYSNIDDVVVWGGEDNTTPYYGKVYIAVKPTTGTTLSDVEKRVIQDDLTQKYSIVSIRPELADPDYIYVTVNTNITYNARLYSRASNLTLETDANTAITDFFDSEVNKFGNALYYSKLTAEIDDISPIVKHNITNLILEKRLEIDAGSASSYTFNFNNAIAPNSLVSNEFTIDGVDYFLKDIPSGDSPYTVGVIGVYRLVGSVVTYLDDDVGSINYNTGEILLPNLRIDDIVLDPIYKILTLQVAQGNFVDADNPDIVTTDYNVYTNDKDDVIVLNAINITLTADNS